MKNWYRVVSGDPGRIPDFLDYFEIEYTNAKSELTLKNKSIEKHAAELPGLVEQRFSQLQEIEGVLEYMNIELRRLRSDEFKKFLEHYNKVLSSRDAEKYIDGVQSIVDWSLLTNEVALLRNKYLGLTKGFEQKGWMLGHVTRLKCAGLDDAMV